MQGPYDRVRAGETWVTWDGDPYVDPTSGRAGSFIEEALSLNEAQLVELGDYWEWRSELAASDAERWWCWTVVRFVHHVLAVRRAYHAPTHRHRS